MSKKEEKKALPENMKKVNLAIVFLDIINSTKFVQKHGAQKSAAWFQVHDRLARNLVYRHEGREIDRSDGFMLSFNNLGQAVQFALAYQETIPKKTPFNSRIGIHWTDIIEVHQDDIYTAVGAKRVELEGIGKATAARCMSLCQEKQVLLTKQAYLKIKSMMDLHRYVSKGTRTAMVGLYQFKGVAAPQVIYAIGNTIESLQPPPSSEKVKRIGGAKKIKSRARDRKIKEWFWWAYFRLGAISFVYLICIFWPFITNKSTRDLFEIDEYFFWVDYINIVVEFVKKTIVDFIGIF